MEIIGLPKRYTNGNQLFNISLLAAAVGNFNPESIFNIASTNPSAYYDRTNLATLFQDSAGTTPVTVDSQPIGLGIDQSKGLVLGPELITNGDFSAGTTGWEVIGDTFNGVTPIVDGGAAKIQINGGVNAQYSRLENLVFTTSVGRVYATTISISEFTGNAPITFTAIGLRGGYGLSARITGDGDYTFIEAATGSGSVKTYLGYNNLASSFSGSAKIDNVSVREVYGVHAIQSTAGKRPITAGYPIYANFDGVDDELVTTFPASLGAGCTVCRSLPGTGASITTGVTIGTTYTDNVDAHALLIFTAAQWAALSAGDIANLTAWLNAKAGL